MLRGTQSEDPGGDLPQRSKDAKRNWTAKFCVWPFGVRDAVGEFRTGSPEARTLEPLAAVDDEGDAVDVGGGVGGEEEGGILDVLDAAEATEGNLFGDLFFEGVWEQAFH